MAQFMDHTSILYNLVFVFLIVAFTYFYTAITLNPVQMAEDMKRNNGFIPGVKPGKPTADYLDQVMSHLTGPGSLFIALMVIKLVKTKYKQSANTPDNAAKTAECP